MDRVETSIRAAGVDAVGICATQVAAFPALAISERRFKNTGKSEHQTPFINDIHSLGQYKSKVLRRVSCPFRRVKVFG